MATDYPKPDSLLCGPRGVGQPFDAILVLKATLTPGSVNGATAAEQTFTVTGIQTTDLVEIMNYTATGNATAIGQVRASAANQVAIQYINPTAGALTPAAGSYSFVVFRPSTNPAK